MIDATLYSNLDAGGPQSNFGGGAKGVAQLYNLLVPCLVTGYGAGDSAKPGQGWTLVHANLPTGFKLQAPDGVYYTFYCPPTVTYSSSPAVQVYLAESLSDLAAYPPVGSNVRSGDFSSSASATTRHWIAVSHYLNNSSYNKGWFLVARGSQVYIVFLTDDDLTTTAGQSAAAGSFGGRYGGEIFMGNPVYKDPAVPKSGPQNHVILGGFEYSASYNYTSEMPMSYLNAYGRTRLRDPLSGVVEPGAMPYFAAHSNIYSESTFYKRDVHVYPPDLIVERRSYWESGPTAVLPGLFMSHFYSYRRLGSIFPRLGRSVSYGSCLSPILIDGEPFYLLPTGYGCSIVSLLEKYWV